jgi:hypothetical protein
VSVETAVPRNAQRQRKVPLGVMLDYRAQIEAAVKQLQPVADEVVEFFNDEAFSGVVRDDDDHSYLTNWWTSVNRGTNVSKVSHGVIENFLNESRSARRGKQGSIKIARR